MRQSRLQFPLGHILGCRHRRNNHHHRERNQFIIKFNAYPRDTIPLRERTEHLPHAAIRNRNHLHCVWNSARITVPSRDEAPIYIRALYPHRPQPHNDRSIQRCATPGLYGIVGDIHRSVLLVWGPGILVERERNIRYPGRWGILRRIFSSHGGPSVRITSEDADRR
jgi:hypothetical protein